MTRSWTHFNAPSKRRLCAQHRRSRDFRGISESDIQGPAKSAAWDAHPRNTAYRVSAALTQRASAKPFRPTMTGILRRAYATERPNQINGHPAIAYVLSSSTAPTATASRSGPKTLYRTAWPLGPRDEKRSGLFTAKRFYNCGAVRRHSVRASAIMIALTMRRAAAISHSTEPLC